jgi:hypothetical protein
MVNQVLISVHLSRVVLLVFDEVNNLRMGTNGNDRIVSSRVAVFLGLMAPK